MTADLKAQKAVLRKRIRAQLGKISLTARKMASLELRATLKEQTFYQIATAVLFFAPLPDEIDVWPLLEESLAAGKIAALPQFDTATQNYVARRVQSPQSDLMAGPFWIPEPKPTCPEIPMNALKLVLVPGVAFDLCGRRLGRGRGFFDRMLAEASSVKCGIAFDEQIVPAIPVEAHDARMDFILTPTRCVRIAG
jgi:5-formyltetrahydrofolate cyclo-ligase